MNACTGQNGTVARQKDNENDKVSWGEFLWVVITGESYGTVLRRMRIT